MLKAIIFDWHGVLEKRTFEGLVKEMYKEFSINFIKGKLNKEFRADLRLYAKGEVPVNDFWRKMKDSFGDRAVDKARSYILSPEIDEDLWEMLPTLRQKYRLAILSDCPQDKMDVIKRDCDLSFFETKVFSCECRLLKNKPEIYHLVLKNLGLSASECLFVDDQNKNIDLAKSIAFKTCKYKKIDDLARMNLLKNSYES